MVPIIEEKSLLINPLSYCVTICLRFNAETVFLPNFLAENYMPTASPMIGEMGHGSG